MKVLKSTTRQEFEAEVLTDGISVKFEKTENERGLYASGVLTKDDKEVGRFTYSDENDRVYLQLGQVEGLGKEKVVGVMRSVIDSFALIAGVETEAPAAAAATGDAEPANED